MPAAALRIGRGHGATSSPLSGGGGVPVLGARLRSMESRQLFLIALVVASALLAVWVSVRVPRLTPQTLAGTVVHVVVGLLAVNTLVPGAMAPLLASDSLLALEVAVVAVALPGFTYALLASLWLLQVCQGALTRGVR